MQEDPIARETGVQPRKSVDFASYVAPHAHTAAGPEPEPGPGPAAAGATAAAPAGAGAGAGAGDTTPAVYGRRGGSLLTPDGRLSLPHMMEEPHRGTSSSSLKRSGSKQEPPANWHSSAAWMSAHASATSAPSSALALPPPEAEQLASACRSRDVKLLQQLLGRRGVSTAHTFDAQGNTALHLVLLPQDPWQQPHAPAAAGAAAPPSHTPAGSRASSGAVAWLTGCFGHGAAADEGSGSRGGSCTLSPAAVAAAQASMVGALLGAGDANVRNRAGATPLMLAARLVLAAASSGSSASSASSSSQLSCALKILEALCKDPLTDANVKDKGGRTALALLFQPPPLLDAGAHGSSSSGSSSGGAGAGAKQSRSKQQVLHGSVGGSGSGASSASHMQQSRAAAAAAAAACAASPAVAAAQLRAAHLLLHAGADCNTADVAGMTPLMHAAAQPGVSKELLQLLLERGANPRALDNSRRSALTHAIVAQRLPALPALGLDPRLRHTFCPACCSSRSRDLIPVVHAPVGGARRTRGGGGGGPAGAPGSSSSTRSGSSSSRGSGSGSGRSGSSSVAAGASSSSCGVVPQGPHHSGLGSCATTVATVTAATPAPSSSCAYCSSSSSSAADGAAGSSSPTTSNGLPAPGAGHAGIIRALCSYGALDLFCGSINTRYIGLNGFGQLHIAMRRGDVLALQMLLTGGADMNAQDSWGNSPLMYWPVTPSQPEELVEELVGRLLSHGANPNLANHEGWVPLDLACELNKLGKVVVKPTCVPVHALLVGWGAKNSDAFKQQHRNPPPLLCMRTDSANSFIRNSKGFGSLRMVPPQELASQVAALRAEEDTSA